MTPSNFAVPSRARMGDAVGAVLGALTTGHHVALGAVILFVALATPSRSLHRRGLDDAAPAVPRLASALVVLGVVAGPLTGWIGAGALALFISVTARIARECYRERRGGTYGAGVATLLVGEPHDVKVAAQQFTAHPEHCVRPVATATPDGSLPTVLPGGALHRIDDLLMRTRARHILVVSPQTESAVTTHLGRSRPVGVRLSVIAPMTELMPGSTVVDVRGQSYITLDPRRSASGASWACKRVFDFVVAALGLLMVLPAFAMIAIAIAIDDGRPVFFRQQRVGRDGRIFLMWKFRSMVRNAEDLRASLAEANEAEGPYFKMENDPRVTRVGRVLRRLSLDEVPQLINVLRGDMSLVGPRPYLASEAAQLPELFEWRSSVLPGITGPWQVAGRSYLPMHEGLRMDLSYVENRSFLLDLRIIARTAVVAFNGDRRPSVKADDIGTLDRRRYATLVDGDELRSRPGQLDLSVVVVTHESAAFIGDCLTSLANLTDSISREVIVVDNASTDGTDDVVRGFRDVRLIRKRRRDGFATNSNIGAVASCGRHVLLLNPDTVVRDGALDELVAELDEHRDVGAVAPQLVYPDGSPQSCARQFPTLRTALVRRTPLRRFFPALGNRHLLHLDGRSHDVDWLLGAAVAIRRDAFVELGGLDDGYRLYCEDADLCWRLHEAGWRVRYKGSITVEHALGEHTRKHLFTVRTLWHFRSMLRFVRLHGLGRPVVGRHQAPATIDLIDLSTPLPAALTA